MREDFASGILFFAKGLQEKIKTLFFSVSRETGM